jgi:AcrB/AcrD/AcrF family
MPSPTSIPIATASSPPRLVGCPQTQSAIRSTGPTTMGLMAIDRASSTAQVLGSADTLMNRKSYWFQPNTMNSLRVADHARPAGTLTYPVVMQLSSARPPATWQLFHPDAGSLDGAFEAPIYGMLAVNNAIAQHDWGSRPKPTISIRGQPADEAHPTLLWDGEWEITYVTFRDMGAAFGVAMLGIYILVVAQFRSFRLPLVILTPIPLTLIGIVFGHWLFGAPFTATSMIGFIALAGIIVRNSILFVDFVRHGAGHGQTLREMLLTAGAIRFKPILLTALSAMIGAATILTDPIFQGLAISLLFGLASSTLLTVLVIPAIYVVLKDSDQVAA